MYHYRTLYNDKILPVFVRVKLVDLLTSLHAADWEGTWTSLTQRRRKRASTQSESHTTTIRHALITMVNDSDHSVRMHVARAITSLFSRSVVQTGTTNGLSEPMSHDRVMLLSNKDQEDTFQEVLEMLHLAYVISDGLDELSSEDESVNRVASKIYTLLLEGCVSPVCERKVVGELVMAVGHGHIDADLVAKV